MLEKENYLTIVRSINNLTNTDRRIDSYLRENYLTICFHSINDLAEKCEVSKSSIGRFLNKLGFTGFAQFKRLVAYSQVKDAFLSNEISDGENNHSDYNTETILQKKIENSFTAIKLMSNNTRLTDYVQTSDSIINSQNLYIIGAESTEVIANYFHSQIRNIKPSTVLLSTSAEHLVKDLASINEQDLLIAFIGNENNINVFKSVKWFKKERAEVIVITSTKTNPIMIYSDLDINLHAASKKISPSMLCVFLCVDFLVSIIKCREGETISTDKVVELENLFKANIKLTG